MLSVLLVHKRVRIRVSEIKYLNLLREGLTDPRRKCLVYIKALAKLISLKINLAGLYLGSAMCVKYVFYFVS